MTPLGLGWHSNSEKKDKIRKRSGGKRKISKKTTRKEKNKVKKDCSKFVIYQKQIGFKKKYPKYETLKGLQKRKGFLYKYIRFNNFENTETKIPNDYEKRKDTKEDINKFWCLDKKKTTLDKFIIDIEFTPYLIKFGNITSKFTNKNKLIQYIYKNKMKRIKKIVYDILDFYYDIKKYVFDKKNSLIKIKMKIKPSAIRHFYKNPREFIPYKKTDKITIDEFTPMFTEELGYLYGSKGDLIGNGAPDSWMGLNILLLKEGEYNKILYEFGISYNNVTITN